ncbi:PAS domain S-box protein [Dyadobacter flavalbus]|uniref:histidine kinase n=1 Tax=Dyadobacter flavalbus TaxID=2579942 RepID=A0A5M8R2L1_9BACT|nr:PAS domain S-box protein [Dyadobacter flavalbus]KAA6440983.1 PAS domain S-box protein [Dyadobacter flavalbus]
MPDDQQPIKDKDLLNRQFDVNFALEAAGLGVWELDPVTWLVKWDERCQRLFGLAEGHELTYEQAITFIHPDDVDRVDSAVQWAFNPESDGLYDVTYRTIGADDGLLRWVRFIGKCYFQTGGQLYRFAGVAQEVTREVEAQRALQESEQRFRMLADALPQAIWITDSSGNVEFLNKWWSDYSGNVVHPDTAGEVANDSLHPDDAPRLMAIFQQAIQQGTGFAIEQRNRSASGEYRWFLNIGEPYRNAQTGEITKWVGMSLDINDRKRAEQALRNSEARFQTLIEEAPVATSLFMGRELRVVVANEPMLAIWGKGPHQVGRTLAEILPEIANQPFLDILDQVYVTGQTYSAKGARADLVYDGVLGTYYFDFTYKPILDDQGQVYAILQMAVDVTHQVVGQQKLQASEARFRQIVEQALMPICLLRGKEMVLELANQPLLNVWNAGPDAFGKPLLDILPEMKDQLILGWLSEVFDKGVTHRLDEIPTYFIRGTGEREDRYFNFIYQPWCESDGQITGVLAMATDITEQVLARKRMEEAAMTLRNANELAHLGSFSVNMVNGLLTVSPLVASWFGFDVLEADTEAFIRSVGEQDRDHVRDSLHQTMQLGSDGRYEITHSVVNAKTGQTIMIHAIGQLYLDAQGKPARVEGIAQDITAQLAQKQFLEEQVEQRTKELQIANQVLAQANVQLEQANTKVSVANEQLQLFVKDLTRSNNNLQQFAYIASHDLQEPLRKIQSLSTLLGVRLGDKLGDGGKDLLNRINKSGAQMSTLIQDLLSYSQIGSHQQDFGLVSLNMVMGNTLESLSVSIKERGAQIVVDDLPIIHGDASQLTQLFQNLVSNGLKFTPSDQVPQIHIQYFKRLLDELPAEVRPNRSASFYHQISVSDKGIGFDVKYLDRIFQVFQRLHGKREYPGTGVGLAIVQQVIENHGGGITASSIPGAGTTFCVYFPG